MVIEFTTVLTMLVKMEEHAYPKATTTTLVNVDMHTVGNIANINPVSLFFYYLFIILIIPIMYYLVYICKILNASPI